MPQSLAQIYIHLIFSTKDRASLIPDLMGDHLHAYLAGVLNGSGNAAVQIGGVADHVHLLFRLSRTSTLADVVRDVKGASSKWMAQDQGIKGFAWQAGYGAFSVSASLIETVTQYIRNQPEHHRTKTFQDEFREWLRRYNVTYDEAYVWD